MMIGGPGGSTLPRVTALALTYILAFMMLVPPLEAGSQEQAPGAANLQITILEGNGAINNIRDQRAKDIVVQVTDGAGRAIQGATVTFNLPTMGASAVFPDGGSSAILVTDAAGQAAARSLRTTNVAGQFEIRVSASYQGEIARETVVQTNAAPAQGGGGSKKALIILLLAGGAAAGAAVALTGGSSGTSTSPPPTQSGAAITPGTPVFGPPR